MNDRVPHLRIVVAVCIASIGGYALFSLWAVLVSHDPAMIGDVGGTWKSFAMLAVGFWLGSSSGGKLKPDSRSAPDPTPSPRSSPTEWPEPQLGLDNGESR